jgi:gluconolactonase
MEPGSNGLVYHEKLNGLILCQHGARQVALLRNGKITPLVRRYTQKKLNSPNDIAVADDGSIFFSDPPYGLPPLTQCK